MADFSHFNEDGRATMVDVGGKNVTERVAVAVGRILVKRDKKGNLFLVEM